MTTPLNPSIAHLASGDIAYSVSGTGPAVLLLHGFPQTQAMWAQVVPALAENFTVVTADLRGYGQSHKPSGVENYSFRAMGADQFDLMTHLGFEEFHLVGHDRGGRTAHRMALDVPQRVKTLTVMDIVPTQTVLTDLTHQVARAYYHWFFLSQPHPLPERMIAADPNAFFESCLVGWGATKITDFDPAQVAAYRAAWNDPECVRAMCDDYRAAIDYDLDLDKSNLKRKIACPSLVMFGRDGVMAREFDIADTWSSKLADMRVAPMDGGHFFVDQYPTETAKVLMDFLSL